MKCSHCPKKFKNDGALRRHKLYCAILCGDNTEHLETPTITEMWTLVQTVLSKNRDLEEKVKSLSQKIIYYEYLSFCTLFFVLGLSDDLKLSFLDSDLNN